MCETQVLSIALTFSMLCNKTLMDTGTEEDGAETMSCISFDHCHSHGPATGGVHWLPGTEVNPWGVL